MTQDKILKTDYSKMSLSNLKTIRTRFRDLLGNAPKKGKSLLAVEIGSLDLLGHIDEIDDQINSLNVLSEKVDNTCAALSIEARNVNRDEEYEQFIEDDNELATAVYECVTGLERRRRELFLSRGKSAEPALEE